MDTNAIKEIVETIKTLNINVNDATTQKLADVILPVAKQYMWVRLAEDIMLFVGLVGTVAFIATLIYKATIADIEK